LIPDEFSGPGSFTFALRECADCTVKGGVNLKPAYWP
jgi:hypothetical protein